MVIKYEDIDVRTDSVNNSQLFLALTGTKEFIKRQLQMLIKECDASYGKPIQGICSHYDGTSVVKTPIWDGKPY